MVKLGVPGNVGHGVVKDREAKRGDAGRAPAGVGGVGRGDAGRGDAGRGDAGRGDAGRGDGGRGDVKDRDGGSDDDSLNEIFAALSDPTRRRVLEALGSGSQSVSNLAQDHGMSLPGFMKHLRVLESAGLIARLKEGRVVRCTLAPEPMQEAAVWLSRYERFWNERLDALGRFLYHQQELKAWPPNPPASPGNARSSSSSESTMPPSKRSGKPGPTRRR